MASETRTSVGSRPWTLLLGPGRNLEELVPFIQALILVPAKAEAPPFQRLENLDGLLSDFSETGRLVVDTDGLLREDVGLVRSFLARRSNWELVLFGDDPTGAATRTLLTLDRTRFLPSPLNVCALRDLCTDSLPGRESSVPPLREEPLESKPIEPARAEAAPAPDPFLDEPEPPLEETEGHDETLAPALLDRVERILRGEGLPAEPLPSQPPSHVAASTTPAATASPASTALDERELLEEPFELDEPFDPTELEELAHRLEPAAPASSPPLSPAPYFKNQIADLADIVQCVDLTLGLAREEVTNESGGVSAMVARRLEELSGEVARLRQFTRTLSFLAAPPIAGNQRFELAPMLEEMLITRRGEPDAPRYLLRTQNPLLVRSDKRLLAQVFDALLFFSHLCAGPDGTVRVDGRLRADRVSISIRFPGGIFAELEPATILEPYALRRSLPELGANSLAAAAGILRGQGGALELRAEESGGFEWLVTLPACQ